jgi:hypothetical protein
MLIVPHHPRPRAAHQVSHLPVHHLAHHGHPGIQARALFSGQLGTGVSRGPCHRDMRPNVVVGPTAEQGLVAIPVRTVCLEKPLRGRSPLRGHGAIFPSPYPERSIYALVLAKSTSSTSWREPYRAWPRSGDSGGYAQDRQHDGMTEAGSNSGAGPSRHGTGTARDVKWPGDLGVRAHPGVAGL